MTYTLIEYMPMHLRDSHRAAGNSGRWPHNGSERLYVAGDVPPSELDEWASVLAEGVSQAAVDAGQYEVSEILPLDAMAEVAS